MSNLDTMTLRFLRIITPEDIRDFPIEYWGPSKSKAQKYLRECPLQEIPKYINNPISPVRVLVKRRLRRGPRTIPTISTVS